MQDMFFTIFWILSAFACSEMDINDGGFGMMEKVFVYGSLKRGEPNHNLLENKGESTKFKGEVKTVDSYPLVITSKYNIPYMLDTPGKGMVIDGELYDVDANTLNKLDVLEDHPNYYNRSKIVFYDNGTEIEAWTYLMQDYKPFMDTLPYLDSYSSMGSHGLPYVTRQERVPGDVNSFIEVKKDSKDIIPPNNRATFNVGTTEEKRHLVFVYGTLKRRERNHIQMIDKNNGRADLIALASTEDKFPLVVDSRFNIPFLLDNKGIGKQVEGEIYLVDATMLAKLDEFEDYPEFYDRKVINALHKNTENPMLVWIYVLHDFKPEMLQRNYLSTFVTSTQRGIPSTERKQMSREEYYDILAEVKINPPIL